MKDIELPPLPEPDICRYVVTVWRDGVECEIDNGPRYTVEQMQAYARAAVEADRAQRVPDGWKLEAAVAIDELLRLIRRNAPELSGKVLGNAQRVLDTELASTPAPAQQERKPMTYREIADATSEWAHVRSDYTIGIIRAAERHHGIFAEPAQGIKE